MTKYFDVSELRFVCKYVNFDDYSYRLSGFYDIYLVKKNKNRKVFFFTLNGNRIISRRLNQSFNTELGSGAS